MINCFIPPIAHPDNRSISDLTRARGLQAAGEDVRLLGGAASGALGIGAETDVGLGGGLFDEVVAALRGLVDQVLG